LAPCIACLGRAILHDACVSLLAIALADMSERIRQFGGTAGTPLGQAQRSL
jgi:hypothetical protein